MLTRSFISTVVQAVGGGRSDTRTAPVWAVFSVPASIRRLRNALPIAVFLLFCSASNNGYGAPMFFTMEADFLSAVNAAGIGLSTEGFEGEATTTFMPSLSVGSISISAPLPASGVRISDTAASVSTGNRALEWDSDVIELVFVFPSPINAIGFDLKDFGDIGPPGNSLTMSNSNGDSSTIFMDFVGTNGNLLFGSLVDPMNSFTEVRFSATASGEAVGFDRLQFGAASVVVPEPSTLVLFGIGIVGLGFLGLRNRRA